MHDDHRHNQCIQSALARADKLCTEKKLRLTPIRHRVLELIWQSHKPIKAYDLLAQLSDEHHIEKPPTVYRALEFLLDNHLIHKIESSNAYIGCEFEHVAGACQFLICDQCEEVKEVKEPSLNATLMKTSENEGFTPRQTHVEIHGLCAQCSK